MSHNARNPVFGVSDQVRHKPGCTITEDGKRLEILDLRRRGIVLSIYVAKTKALISFAFTANLIPASFFFFFCIWKKPVFSRRGSYNEIRSLIILAFCCI